jgi:hypothetical protein
MSKVDLASSVTPPANVLTRATVATVEHLVVPPEWYKGYITIQADGEKCYVIVDTAPTTSTSITGAAASVSAGPTGTSGHPIFDGGTLPVNLQEIPRTSPSDVIYIHHISPTGAAGYIRVTQSSGPQVTPA